MSKLISFKKNKTQNNLIISEMNGLISKLAYDGRSRIKVRLRKSEKDLLYLIEAESGNSNVSKTIELAYDPFNIWFLYTKHQIKKSTFIRHSRKSRFGGYTFYK